MSHRTAHSFRVWYDRRDELWKVWVDGQPIVKRESRGLSTRTRDYHEYERKADAVTQARQMAKRNEDLAIKTELEIETKGGKVTDRRTYGD